MSLAIVIALVLLCPTGTAWWWTNNPPGVSHQCANDPDVDAVAEGFILDKAETITQFVFNTGGPINNPELVQLDPVQRYCVWSIHYNITATMSGNPPGDLVSNMIEVHSYLDILTNSTTWNQVSGDWMCAQAIQPNQTDNQVGCLNLYYNQHTYQPGEKYRVRIEFKAAWYDDDAPPYNRNLVFNGAMEAYYEII